LEKEKRCALESWRGTGCELPPPANSENSSRFLRWSGELYQKARDESRGMMDVKESLRGVEG